MVGISLHDSTLETDRDDAIDVDQEFAVAVMFSYAILRHIAAMSPGLAH